MADENTTPNTVTPISGTTNENSNPVQPVSNQETVAEDTPKTDGNSEVGGDTSADKEEKVKTADEVLSEAEKVKNLSDEELASQATKLKDAIEVLPEDMAKDLRAHLTVLEDEIKKRAEKVKEEVEAESEAEKEKLESEEAALKTKLKKIGLYGGAGTAYIGIVFLVAFAVLHW